MNVKTYRRWLWPSLVMVLTVGWLQAVAHAKEGEEFASTHQAHTLSANQPLLNWLANTRLDINGQLARRGQPDGPPDFLRYDMREEAPQFFVPTEAEAKRDYKTYLMNQRLMPQSQNRRNFTAFFESGHPWIMTDRGGYAVDSHAMSRITHPEVYKGALDLLVKEGVGNIRIGPMLSNRNEVPRLDATTGKFYSEAQEQKVKEVKINDPMSWDPFIQNYILPAWERGIVPTISVVFFANFNRPEWITPLPNGERGEDGSGVDYYKSFLLHPSLPSDMGKMAKGLAQRLKAYKAQFEASHPGQTVHVIFNPVNESETQGGFEGQFWDQKVGRWGSRDQMRYYVPAIINIGKMNVEIRQAIQSEWPEPVLFTHVQAMTPDNYPSHKGDLHYAVDKFMLGDLVTTTNFDQYLVEDVGTMQIRVQQAGVNEIDAAFKHYVFGRGLSLSQKQEAIRYLVREFNDLKARHLRYLRQTGFTAKDNTQLHLDYYYQTEFILTKTVPELITELSANSGERLKQVLEFTDDQAFIEAVGRAAVKVEGILGTTGRLWNNPRSRGDINFRELLSREDGLVLSELIGLRSSYSLNADPLFVERRKGVTGIQEGRTDQMLNDLVGSDGQGSKLVRALGAANEAQMYQMVAAAARDTRDGKGKVQFRSGDTLRDMLDRDERRVLHRLMGLGRERMLGFEPQHYQIQVSLGIREGLLPYFARYVNELRLSVVGMGENGGPFYVFGSILHTQMMMKMVSAGAHGVYLTQFGVGVMDTRLWARSPLALHIRDDHEVTPAGAISAVPYVDQSGKRAFRAEMRRWQGQDSWFENFARPVQKSTGAFRDFLPRHSLRYGGAASVSTSRPLIYNVRVGVADQRACARLLRAN